MIESRNYHDQSGIALITALVTLLIVTIIGISGLNSSMMQSKVAASIKEYYSAFQAAETAISIAQRSPQSFTAAITNGSSASVSTDSADALYSNTTLSAEVNYMGEGTMVFDSSIGTFKPQYFAIDGSATRTGSKGTATHSQGYRVLAPSS